MTLATGNYAFGGVSLHNGRSWNVRLLSPSETLQRRGENIALPGITGQTHVEKYFEQRELTLAIVVTGELPGQPPKAEVLANNLAVLQGLFAVDGQSTLTRKRGTRTESALAECVNMNVVPRGPLHADLIVDLLLSDPLWYDTTQQVSTHPFSSVPYSGTVNNPGSYRSEKIVVTLTCGALTSITDPTITIGNTWVKYTGTVAATQTLQIDVGNFTATKASSSVIDAITWNQGQARWLLLQKGSNIIQVTAAGISNTPTVYVTFYPPYV